MKTKSIRPKSLYWATFNRFEMRLPGQCVTDCAHSGSCDRDVTYWAPIVSAQVEKDNFPNRPTPAKVRAELAEYGAWDAEELADDAQNWLRIVWLAANDISESDAPDCSKPVPRLPVPPPSPVLTSNCGAHDDMQRNLAAGKVVTRSTLPA